MIIQYQWIRVHNTFNNRLTEAIDEGPGASDPSGKTPDRWGREPSKKCLRAAIVEVRNSSGKSKVLKQSQEKTKPKLSIRQNIARVQRWHNEGKWLLNCRARLCQEPCNITQWFKGISFSGEKFQVFPVHPSSKTSGCRTRYPYQLSCTFCEILPDRKWVHHRPWKTCLLSVFVQDTHVTHRFAHGCNSLAGKAWHLA